MILRISVAAALWAIASLWSAGALFLLAGKLHYKSARPWTLFEYIYHFGESNPLVIKNATISISLCGIAMFFLTVATYRFIFSESQHGEAKWASKHHVKDAGLFGNGILLGKAFGRYISLPGDLFALVIAATRGGKGVGIVIPNLLSWSQSAVTLDIKGENFAVTSGFRQKHGQEVYYLNPLNEDLRTHRYNPLGYCSSDPDRRIDDIQKIANFLVPTPPRADPMWSSEARDLFVGVALLLFHVKHDSITLGEVLRQLKTEGGAQKYFAMMVSSHHDKLSPQCIAALSHFSDKPPREASGVLSSLTSALNLYANPIFDAATSCNDFDLRDIRKKKMSIYVCVSPDNLRRMAPFMNMFYQQLIDLNTREMPHRVVGKAESGNPDLKYKVLMVFDEFTSIGRLEIIENALPFMAGYGLQMLTIMQSASQLSVYENEFANTLMSNHAAHVYFRPNKMKTASEIAEELGYKTVTQTSKSVSMGMQGKPGSASRSKAKRLLMLPQEIKRLHKSKAIILVAGIFPILAKKIIYYKDKNFKKRILPAVVIPRIEVDPRSSRSAEEIRTHSNVKLYDDSTEEEISIAAETFFNNLIEAA